MESVFAKADLDMESQYSLIDGRRVRCIYLNVAKGVRLRHVVGATQHQLVLIVASPGATKISPWVPFDRAAVVDRYYAQPIDGSRDCRFPAIMKAIG